MSVACLRPTVCLVTWRDRLRAAQPWLDVGLAGALLVVGESQVWTGWHDGGVGALPDGHQLARALLVVGFVVPLAWRRRAPLATVSVTCAAIVAQVLAVTAYVPFLTGLLPMAIGNYTSAAYARRWRAGSLVAVFAAEAVIYARIPEERVGGEVLFSLFVMVGTWLAGDVVHGRLTRAERSVREAQLSAAGAEAAAAAALAEERARIARELHDVIAHSVSVMGVQAGAARALLDRDLDAARDALRAVETSARSSVDELQRLLTVLRGAGPAGGDRAPQPGLGELPELIDRMRAAGMPVELSMRVVDPLPAGVELAAYRIAQEALTNVLKHADAPATVAIEHDHGQLRIEVRDTGPGPSAGSNPGGHGLVGMRERAALYGGTVRAGAHPDGGFVVHACLPVTGTGAA